MANPKQPIATAQPDPARNWQVIRNCCTSGYCVDCHTAGRVGRPGRIVHADRLTKAKAEEIARNWAGYAATAAEMPQQQPPASEGITR